MNEGQNDAQGEDRKDLITLISEVIDDSATNRSGQILPQTIGRLLLRGSFEEQHYKAREDRDRDPIKDSFQSGAPLRKTTDIA